MTKISINPVNPGVRDSRFRATAQQHESIGETPGAALDALTTQLSEEESGTLIVIVNKGAAATPRGSLCELFAEWEAEDGTNDPAEIARRNVEVEEFEQAMNQNRLEMEGPGSRKPFP